VARHASLEWQRLRAWKARWLRGAGVVVAGGGEEETRKDEDAVVVVMAAMGGMEGGVWGLEEVEEERRKGWCRGGVGWSVHGHRMEIMGRR
jgi:hypothetical protein